MKYILFAALWFAAPCVLLAEMTELIYDGNLVQVTDVDRIGDLDYLSIKSAAAMFRGRTQWFPIAEKVILHVNNQKISFSVGSRAAQIGSRSVQMQGRARMSKKGSLLVPVEFFTSPDFTSVVDCKVTWDAAAQVLLAEPNVTLFSPRVYSRGRHTRVVFETAEEFSPAVKKSGGVIVAEIPRARIVGEETLKINDKVIRKVAVARERRGATIRITLAEKTTAYTWLQETDPSRLVFQIQNPRPTADLPEPEEKEEPKPKAAVSVPDPKPATVPAIAAPETPLLVPAAQTPGGVSKKSGRVRKIVVDAGHGGKDPGAIGRLGTKEKDINLLIAQELAHVLRVEGGYEVLLTRSSDVFIPLVDRSVFANDNRADLFISIHCNASVSRSQNGLEVYYLAEDASDPHAEAAEHLENAVVALEGPVSPQKQRLQELLFSMAQNEFINEASLLSNAVIAAADKRMETETRGVKQANFHVLHGAQMPSILIETGFITNAAEEGKLRKRKFRSSLVDAVLTAVQDYEKKIILLQGKKR